MNSTKDTLKALIKQSGLNQIEFDKKHGIGYNKLSRWANGTVIVSIEKLQKIAEAEGLKINVEYSIINL
jgi:transcriptional regulator with XRE-family HTH domain